MLYKLCLFLLFYINSHVSSVLVMHLYVSCTVVVVYINVYCIILVLCATLIVFFGLP